MPFPVIFLDDGGVMNDNRRRGPQWRRHVADFMAPRLGGSKAAWGRANAAVAGGLFEEMAQAAPGTPAYGWWTDVDAYLDMWLIRSCREVGMEPPGEAAERLALAREANDYVTRRVRAAVPGAIPAIRALRRRGYTLHTASGEFEADLAGYLEGMGVRDCFGTLYGCDLVGVPKIEPGYYRRLFRHAGVDSREALIVDDREQMLDWAAAEGARTVLCREAPPTDGRHGHIARLAELPALLRREQRRRRSGGAA